MLFKAHVAPRLSEVSLYENDYGAGAAAAQDRFSWTIYRTRETAELIRATLVISRHVDHLHTAFHQEWIRDLYEKGPGRVSPLSVDSLGTWVP
jgi:hypothetical protein